MSLFTEQVTLRTAGGIIGEDDYGDPIYGPPQQASVAAWWEPRGSSEDTAAAEQYVSGYWLYCPLGTDLAGADVVILMGEEYQVIGQPGVQPGGYVIEGFIKAAVERVTG